MFLGRGLFYRLLFCLIVLPLGYFSCVGNHRVQGPKSYFKLLTGDSVRYWNPHFTNEEKIIGLGWIFSTDKSFKEFEYAPKSKRRVYLSNLSYYMEMSHYSFSLSGDTLVLSIYNDYRFKILKINEDTLQVENIDNYGNGNNHLLFTKSEDQKTKPIFLNLNPDSLMKEFGP